MRKAAEILRAPHFYRPAHQRIFAACFELCERNEPVDLITAADELDRRKELEAAGGAAYLAELVDGTPTARNVAHYARIVKREADRRHLCEACTRTAEKAQQGSDVGALVADLRRKLGAIIHNDAGAPSPELTLAAEALYGLAGRVVATIGPYSEADPVAVLAHLLAAMGNLVGPGPHALVGHDCHPLRLNVVLVGPTGKGRKGTGWSEPRHLLTQVDDGWARNRVRTGLSSGEGLIYHVRDRREELQPVKEKGRVVEYERVMVDEGEEDKRLLIIEPEFAVMLKVMGREGNALSGVIRQAWDTGNLSTLTKNSPLRATGAHVSILGHTTEEEVRRYLTQTERANGFANRFLWLLVRRSKLLPEGAAVPDNALAPLVEELREVVSFAGTVGEIARDEEARAIWTDVYPRLSEGEAGMVGAILSRSEVQVLRLSALYAVLDRSRVVRRAHLYAALALWDYAEASVRRIFGDRLGFATADTILDALRARGRMTRTGIYALFGGHKGKAEIEPALEYLYVMRLAQPLDVETNGRTAEAWEAVGGLAKEAR